MGIFTISLDNFNNRRNCNHIQIEPIAVMHTDPTPQSPQRFDQSRLDPDQKKKPWKNLNLIWGFGILNQLQIVIFPWKYKSKMQISL